MEFQLAQNLNECIRLCTQISVELEACESCLSEALHGEILTSLNQLIETLSEKNSNFKNELQVLLSACVS